MNKKLWQQIYQYVLGVIVVLIAALAFYLLAKFAIPEGNNDVLMVLVGVFASQFTSVVQYFFGSSKGSSDKNEILKGGSGQG